MIGNVHLPVSLKTLLRGESQALAAMLNQSSARLLVRDLFGTIIIGCGLYGASIGLWRAPLMAVYVGIKMPMLVLLTLLVNGLINGMLAQVLGSGLSFRQTMQACLMCFASFALIVGSLSPLIIAFVLDAPPPDTAAGDAWYRMFLLTHTALIAFAGIVANHKLLRLLQSFAGSDIIGRRTLIAWLAGNLFVGAQLSYTLRPFFGSPRIEVQFLRDQPFEGNFYLVIWNLLREAVGDQFLPFLGDRLLPLLFLAVALGAVVSPFLVLVWLVRRSRR